MPNIYATLAQFYEAGLRAEAFSASSRIPSAVDPTSGTITLPGHGLDTDDSFTWVVQGAAVSGASGGAIPTGASLTTLYYAIKLGFAQFQASLTAGGSAVTYSDAGRPVFGIAIDPEPKICAMLEQVSREVDDDLVAYNGPIEVYVVGPYAGQYPRILSGLVAREAARRLVPIFGLSNPQYEKALERLFAEQKRDDARRAAWRNEEPLDALPVDQDPNVAADGAVSLGGDTERNFYGGRPGAREWL